MRQSKPNEIIIEKESKVTLTFREFPLDAGDLLLAGYSCTQILDMQEDYYSKGILPSARQVSPNNSIEKSIHVFSSKYPQYQVKQYVDVKHRNLNVWNLVGNGESYPTVIKDGEFRAGCGYLYKDEGLGCLSVDNHTDHKAIVKLIVNSCMRPQCPICYEKWAGREAFRIEARFKRVPKLSGEDPSIAESRTNWGVPIHVVISIPGIEAYLMDDVELKPEKGKWVKKYGFKQLKKKMQRIAKMAGFLGGVAIFHPFANDELNEDESIDIKIDPHSGEFDFKSLKSYFSKRNKNIKLWYVRPHFHLIGYGWIVDTDKINAKTGWVVKNLGVRDSVVSTALYQLSHAGFLQGIHTVSWFGVMSNRTFKDCNPLPPLPPGAPLCPECEAELKPVRWMGEGPSPLDYVSEEGYYFTEAEGWEYIPRKLYRGRIVHPLEGERIK